MKRLAALLALAPLGACVAPPGGASLPLADTEWRMLALDGAPAASPDRARLGFRDDRISASVGCNGMGGDYRIENGRLIAGPLIGTKMFCEGPVGEQEVALGALLVGAPQLRLEGNRLSLVSSGHRAEFARITQ